MEIIYETQPEKQNGKGHMNGPNLSSEALHSKPSLETVNSWRTLGMCAPQHTHFYHSLYLDKLKRRQITDIAERKKFCVPVDGIDVWLPFEPYSCQRDYIEKVVEALKTKSNAMLESPTGTGKTISFLCAAVAFIKKERERQLNQNCGQVAGDQNKQSSNEVPALTTIIYCTRTHSQIQQVINEINTNLPYKVSAQTLASKQQLCIYEDLKSDLQIHMLNHKCSRLRQSKRTTEVSEFQGDSWMEREEFGNRKHKKQQHLEPNQIKELASACPFYYGEEIKMHAPPAFRDKRFNPIIDMIDARVIQSASKQSCLDIEDLVQVGKQNGICPYYLAKSRVGAADIVILPYQYILTSQIRKQLQINLHNSIIIFDEAHNIDTNCEEVLSFEIQIEQFWEAFRYLDNFSKHACEEDYDSYQRKKKATHLKCFMLRLQNAIKSIDLKKKKNALGGVQKCITNIFILELEDFLSIVDKLLLETGERYEFVYQSDDSEDGFDSRGQFDANQATCSRNFEEKQGHKQQGACVMETLSNHSSPCPNHAISQMQDSGNGVLATKNGRKVMQYKKRDEDVLYEELRRLIESAYACLDQTNFQAEPDHNLEETDNLHCLKDERTRNQSEPNTLLQKQRTKVSCIIEMFEKIMKIKKLIKQSSRQSSELEDFKFFIRTNKNLKRQRQSQNDQHITQFGIHCLNPSYVFKQMMGEDTPECKPRSVILTSGTLSPMRILYSELRTHFKVKLINEHFIKDSQVFASIVTSDFMQNSFKFNFENQDMKKSFRDLGRFLLQLNRCIHGGILMFFTSYTHIQECYRQFCESGYNFEKAKIFQEDKNHAQSMQNYQDYMAHIKTHNKGILMCVSRGKLSEGLNFSDNLARACLVIGIPYLLVNDSRVNLKKQYLDQNSKQEQTPEGEDPVSRQQSQYQNHQNQMQALAGQRNYQQITGDYWYKMTAIREVNQIIGRCIRHQSDYASIFLIDERYEKQIIKNKLSKWIKSRLRTFDKFQDLEEDLRTFFTQNELTQYQIQSKEYQLLHTADEKEKKKQKMLSDIHQRQFQIQSQDQSDKLQSEPNLSSQDQIGDLCDLISSQSSISLDENMLESSASIEPKLVSSSVLSQTERQDLSAALRQDSSFNQGESTFNKPQIDHYEDCSNNSFDFAQSEIAAYLSQRDFKAMNGHQRSPDFTVGEATVAALMDSKDLVPESQLSIDLDDLESQLLKSQQAAEKTFSYSQINIDISLKQNSSDLSAVDADRRELLKEAESDENTNLYQPLEKLRAMQARKNEITKHLFPNNQEEETTVTGGMVNITEGQLSGADKTLIFGNVDLVAEQAQYDIFNNIQSLRARPQEQHQYQQSLQMRQRHKPDIQSSLLDSHIPKRPRYQ